MVPISSTGSHTLNEVNSMSSMHMKMCTLHTHPTQCRPLTRRAQRERQAQGVNKTGAWESEVGARSAKMSRI